MRLAGRTPAAGMVDRRIRRTGAGTLDGSRVYSTPGSGSRREAALLTTAAVIIPIVEIPQSSKKKYW